MNKSNIRSLTSVLALVIFAVLGCNMSTANLSGLKVSKDKEGMSETSSFKAGDTIYGKADVSNNPGKVKVKLSVSDSKGEIMKGSEVSVDLDGDGFATYTLPVREGMSAGSYKLTADMLNDTGEKKDSKTAAFSITE